MNENNNKPDNVNRIKEDGAKAVRENMSKSLRTYEKKAAKQIISNENYKSKFRRLRGDVSDIGSPAGSQGSEVSPKKFRTAVNTNVYPPKLTIIEESVKIENCENKNGLDFGGIAERDIIAEIGLNGDAKEILTACNNHEPILLLLEKCEKHLFDKHKNSKLQLEVMLFLNKHNQEAIALTEAEAKDEHNQMRPVRA